jgi:hypothetical protein
MNPRLPLSALCLLSSVLSLTAHAQEGRSRPVGYLVQTIPPNQTRSFSVPFDADLSSQTHTAGKLTAVGADYVENSAAAWTAGAFSNADAPYFLRLTSGAHAGRTFRITTPANTATRLYLADDGLGLASLGVEAGAAGARYEIIPGDTLATFFGTTTPTDTLVVQGAADPAQADIVQVWGGAAWLNFYYNTNWARWARDTDVQADPSRNSFLLRSDRGLMLTRRGATPLELAVIGRVLATPQRAVHSRTENSLTFLATMQTGDVTLGGLALQSGTRTAGWRGAADPAQADQLMVWSGSVWFAFYYNTTNNRWQLVGDPASRDGYVIKAGTPVFVQRRVAGATAADKTVVFPAQGS